MCAAFTVVLAPGDIAGYFFLDQKKALRFLDEVIDLGLSEAAGGGAGGTGTDPGSSTANDVARPFGAGAGEAMGEASGAREGATQVGNSTAGYAGG